MEVPQRRGYEVVLGYLARSVQAAVFVIINYAFFFLVPSTIFNLTGRLTPDVEATITGYSSAIIVLTVMRIILKDHILGTASAIALGLVELSYIYTVTQGGVLAINFSGFFVTLDFKPLVYLMMTLPLLGIVKQVFSMMHRSAAQPVTLVEVVAE